MKTSTFMVIRFFIIYPFVFCDTLLCLFNRIRKIKKTDDEFKTGLRYPFLYSPGVMESPLGDRQFCMLVDNRLKQLERIGVVDFSEIEHDLELQAEIKMALRSQDYRKLDALIGKKSL